MKKGAAFSTLILVRIFCSEQLHLWTSIKINRFCYNCGSAIWIGLLFTIWICKIILLWHSLFRLVSFIFLWKLLRINQCIDLPLLQQWCPSVCVEEKNKIQHHSSTASQNLFSSNVVFVISQSEREYSYVPLLPNYFNLLEMKIVGKEFPFCKYPTPSFNTFTFG